MVKVSTEESCITRLVNGFKRLSSLPVVLARTSQPHEDPQTHLLAISGIKISSLASSPLILINLHEFESGSQALNNNIGTPNADIVISKHKMEFHALSYSSFLLFSVYVFLHCSLAVGSIQAVKTITVDTSGNGNFNTIQAAIDSVPDGNSQWIRVHVHQGVYKEQVKIPKEKQFILLDGQGSDSTVIQWNAHTVPSDEEFGTAAFSVSADNFIAREITFQNSFDYKSNKAIAVAAAIQGDKCSFYNCKFLGYQDTLCDYQGRHYFNQCWIEGGVDFIFGRAASVYEGCTLNSILLEKGPSWLTAHSKVNLSAPGGFVFKNCKITGSGSMYLGRAWNDHATVLFYNTFMSDLVVPLGWDSWKQHDMSQITYAEESCTGPGSDKGKRVPWEKKLSAQEWNKYLGREFINQDGWIEQNAP
ncbi:putative pectinesterase 66 [Carex rostrata]